MGFNEQIMQERNRGLSQLRISHSMVKKTVFGDVQIQLWRDAQGSPYIRMERGNPQEKTYALQDFLSYAEAVQTMADVVREKTGEL